MKRFFMLLTFISLWTGASFAQDYPEQSTRSSMDQQAWRYRDHTGWTPYLGAGVGYTNNTNNLYAEGVPSSVKIIGSYQLKSTKGIFDLGYGLQNQSFSQTKALENNISTAAMELAARYQFETQLQLGIVYNQLFNKGQNFGANQADVEFAGVQLLKEFGMGSDYAGRFGVKILTSLNVNNETSNMYMLEFQIGWGGAGPASTASN